MAAKAEVWPRPLKLAAIMSCVETAFGEALRRLKLDVLSTDDSPIPITVLPFFLVDISSDSSIAIRRLKDWKDCQDNGHKLLFGFYDHGCHQDYPGWALRNYIAFLSLRLKIEKVQFLCYREKRSELDLEKSLIGEASFPPPHGWDDSDYVPEAIGWEGEKPGDGRKEKKLKEINLELMDPAR